MVHCTTIVYCTAHGATYHIKQCKTIVYHVLHQHMPYSTMPWYPISDDELAAARWYPPARSLQHFCCMPSWLMGANFTVFWLKMAQTISAHFDIYLFPQLKVLQQFSCKTGFMLQQQALDLDISAQFFFVFSCLITMPWLCLDAADCWVLGGVHHKAMCRWCKRFFSKFFCNKGSATRVMHGLTSVALTLMALASADVLGWTWP